MVRTDDSEESSTASAGAGASRKAPATDATITGATTEADCIFHASLPVPRPPAIRWRAVEDVIAHWNPDYIPSYLL